MNATTTRNAMQTEVFPTSPGKAIVTIGDQTYLFIDEQTQVRIEKYDGSGTTYICQQGPKGCHGCNCPAMRYGRKECRHTKAADKFLDEVF